jgi:hypothetical protein
MSQFTQRRRELVDHLRGSGALIYRGSRMTACGARYDLRIERDLLINGDAIAPGLQDGHGTIELDRVVLGAWEQPGIFALRLDDGRDVDIILRDAGPTTRLINVLTSGDFHSSALGSS